MTATPAVRHLQQLDELINRIVREAELIHDYVQVRFHGGLVLTLNNPVALAGQVLANSPAGRIALAAIVGRTVNDVTRAADQIIVNFRGGLALAMSLQPSSRRSPEVLTLSGRRAAADRPCWAG
jgi:hypothetical protein